jgi:hypothetical protein
MSGPESADFELFAYLGNGGSPYPATVTLDASGIGWTNPEGAGRIGYGEIAIIELLLGDPRRGERPDCCVISTTAGTALKVFCEMGATSREKDALLERRRVYSDFVRVLHRKLGPENLNRITFRTDSEFSIRSERRFVSGCTASAVLAMGLFLAIGHAIVIGIGCALFQIVWVVANFEERPRTYCPDPLDEKFLPR